MAQDVTVLSVPGSGTNFVMRFLEKMHYAQIQLDNQYHWKMTDRRRPDWVYFNQLHPNRVLEEKYRLWTDLPKKAIVTIRPPDLMWLSNQRYQGITLDQQVESWECLWRMMERFDCFIFPVHMDGRLRLTLLQQMCKHIKASAMPQVISHYADAWEPVNAHDYPEKDNWIMSGKAKESRLQLATDWYHHEHVHMRIFLRKTLNDQLVSATKYPESG